MSRRPIRDAGKLADLLDAYLLAILPQDQDACVILYRSELALLTIALHGLAKRQDGQPAPPEIIRRLLDPRDRGTEGTGSLVRLMTPQEIDNVLGPARAAIPDAPSPSSCAPPTPACSPRFGQSAHIHGTDASIDRSPVAAGSHTYRSAGAR